eukprot:UN32868
MLKNVSCRLKSGGYFIGTTTDANRLIKRWREEPAHVHNFGNELYNVRFDPKTSDERLKKLDPNKPYGLKYYLTLMMLLTNVLNL